MNVIALIVAAGQGKRMNSETPKQYLEIDGKTILRQAIDIFVNHPLVQRVQVVINKEHTDLYNQSVSGINILPPVTGGQERHNSVINGLKAIETHHPDIVLVHDAARPFVTEDLITRCINQATEKGSAIPVIRINDTIKQIDNGIIVNSLNRNNVVRIQTPQAFNYHELLEAYSQIGNNIVTDESSVYELLKKDVHIIDGEESNIKITTQTDLENKANNMEYRVGTGYDVHKFTEIGAVDKHIMLGGIAIAHDQEIIAHSDGDVVLHSLVDAILGSIAGGDIGQHFPPTDPKWKNASSDKFLIHAHDLLKAKGGKLVNADVTIICERPKISPHILLMREKIAAILETDIDRISIKATTEEKMGFTGRREGIAAQSVVSISIFIK